MTMIGVATIIRETTWNISLLKEDKYYRSKDGAIGGWGIKILP